MLKIINYKNILYSFWIGATIGLFSQLTAFDEMQLKPFVISLIVSGGLGLFIGTLIEVVTAILPISLANPKTYFLINNMVAIVTTLIVIIAIKIFMKVEVDEKVFRNILVVAVFVIASVNALEYMMYKKFNKKLQNYQDRSRQT